MRTTSAWAVALLGVAPLFGETRVWTGDGADARVSTVANWQGGVAPAAAGDVLDFGAAVATRVENDVAGIRVNGLAIDAGAGEYVFAGLPWTIGGNGGITIEPSAGATQTFDAGLLFDGWNRPVNIPAGHTAIFNGVIGHAAASNCSVRLNGAGTKIIRGGMKVSACMDTNNDANSQASRLQYGTFIIEGDVDLPRYILGNADSDPASLAVTNGAVLRNWRSGLNSFIQSCTIDLCGGRLMNDGDLLVAQDPRSTSRIRIRRDGVFSTGTSFRCANNGWAEFTLEEGGTFYWMGGVFSENGQTTFTVNGGRLVCGGNGFGVLGVGQRPANDTSYQNKGGNILNFNGGEIWCTGVSNNSDVKRNKGTPTTVNLNGGTFMCGLSVESFWREDLDSLVLTAQAGGARVDTRGCNVGWNASVTGEGGFTKLGLGTLTVSAPQTFAGEVRVQAGVVALADPAFVTQRVALAPGGVFAPGGAASLAGLSVRDGVLRLACVDGATALTLVAAPEVEGTLFFDLREASGEPLATPGTYALLAAPGLDATFAAVCRVQDGCADRGYSFAVAEGVLTVTVGEGATSGPAQSTWTATAGGDWTESANWSVGVPDGVGAVATLGGEGAKGPVTLARDVTVGSLVFSGETSYSVTGAGALTFTSPAGGAVIDARGGRQEIAVPVVSAAPLRVTTSNRGKVVFSGDTSGVQCIHVTNGVVASSDLATLPKYLLSNSTFEYMGTAAATVSGELRQDGNAIVRQAEGAGAMTLCLTPFLSRESTLYLQGGAAPISLGGTGWNLQPLNGRRIWLDGGEFRFLPNLRMTWNYTGDGMTRIGATGAERPTSLVIEDGARVRWREVWMGGEREAASAVRVEQRGGEVALSEDLYLNRGAQTNDMDYVLSGGTLTGARWIDFMHGAATFRQTGGRATFDGFSFGWRDRTGDNFTRNERGPSGRLDIEGGAFAVANNWNWLGESGGRREDRVRVAGGELTMPATRRTNAYNPQRPTSFSTLELAGGTLRFGGVGAAGSASDYLAGLNYLSLTGAATIDTAADATVTQPLTVCSDATALVKTGTGALTFAATNDVPAMIAVEEGVLVARFRTETQASRPDGLLALWTFDGEDPCRDATGHGYDLTQAVDGIEVQFSEEKAHAGRSAWWQTPGAVLKCTNIVSALLQRATVSLWVRLETKSTFKSHIGFFSMRNNLTATGITLSFDIAYKESITTPAGTGCGIGNCFFGSDRTGVLKSQGGDISVQEWHMVTITRDEARVRGYIDGVLCTDVDIGADRRENTLLEQGRMITLGGNISTAGEGFRELMNKDGRLDDVALYSRCLSDAEVAALYAVQVRAPAAREVRVAAGATLSLYGSSLATARLAGAGTLAEGAVTVTEALAVDPAAPLTADAFVLGEGGVVDCCRTEADPLPTAGTVTLVHANAVTGNPGKWRVTGTGWAPNRGRARLAVDAGRNLVLELSSSGTILLVR